MVEEACKFPPRSNVLTYRLPAQTAMRTTSSWGSGARTRWTLQRRGHGLLQQPEVTVLTLLKNYAKL